MVTIACQAAEKHPSVTDCLYMHNVAKKGPKKPNVALGFSFTSDFKKKPLNYMTIKTDHLEIS